jgi:hypothetical protein
MPVTSGPHPHPHLRLLLGVAAVLTVASVPIVAESTSFNFAPINDTSACVSFRPTSSSVWAHVDPAGVTARSAERLCQLYAPLAITGVLTTTDPSCAASTSTKRYTTNIDCPNKYSTSDCVISGSTTADFPYGSDNLGVGIRCIFNTTWASASAFTSVTTSAIALGGVKGSQVSRTISATAKIDVNGVRPDSGFADGTICIPSLNSTPAYGSPVANALCRTAGLSVTNASVIRSSSVSSTRIYASNIQCSASSTATLWNGGCTNTTHFYDAPSSADCPGNRPQLTCPVTFDMKLGDPIQSTTTSDNGFQLVQLRPANGAAAYDGVMCVSPSTTTHSTFARLMCEEMYGAANIDFTLFSTSRVALPSTTKTYLSAVTCASKTSTSLSQCTAIAAASTAMQTPCTNYPALIACKMNISASIFSLSGYAGTTSSIESTTAGKGYLKAEITGTGNLGPVCSDGFDQTAARAACRSVGFTPGSSVSYSTGIRPASNTISRVTCPPGASTLANCTLQYSGSGSALYPDGNSPCSGQVYIDCGLPSPSIQYRTTSNGYLQARVYTNAEWGWVTGTAFAQNAVYRSMCSQAVSTTADPSVRKSFVSLSSCPDGETNVQGCSIRFTNGAAASETCNCDSNSNTPAPYSPPALTSSGSMSVIIALAIAIPLVTVAVIMLVCFCVKRRRNAAQGLTPNGSVPSTVSPAQNNPAAYNFATSSGAPSNGATYGNSAPSASTGTILGSDGKVLSSSPASGAMGSPYTYENSFPQQQGGLYGNPVSSHGVPPQGAYGAGSIYGNPAPTTHSYI